MFSKLLLCAAVLMLISACGGQQMPPTSPTMSGSGACISNCPVITADQVFSNIAETWYFQSGNGCLSWIDVLPQSDGSTVWHYQKNTAYCYWAPGASNAELYFNLARDLNGNWYSTGGHVMFPEGCPWCSGPTDFIYTVNPDPGKPRGYLIIDHASTDPPLYTTVSGGIAWSTTTGMEFITVPTYSGPALVSYQTEGPCVREKWWFAPGKGLVKVAPLDIGDCNGLPSSLTMVRIN